MTWVFFLTIVFTLDEKRNTTFSKEKAFRLVAEVHVPFLETLSSFVVMLTVTDPGFPRGAPAYYLTKFSWEQLENEETGLRRVRNFAQMRHGFMVSDQSLKSGDLDSNLSVRLKRNNDRTSRHPSSSILVPTPWQKTACLLETVEAHLIMCTYMESF